MILPDSPYVLLDDARVLNASPARLYAHPVECLTARNLDEIEPLLEALRSANAQGLHAAGFVAYDAGGRVPSACNKAF